MKWHSTLPLYPRKCSFRKLHCKVTFSPSNYIYCWTSLLGAFSDSYIPGMIFFDYQSRNTTLYILFISANSEDTTNDDIHAADTGGAFANGTTIEISYSRSINIWSIFTIDIVKRTLIHLSIFCVEIQGKCAMAAQKIHFGEILIWTGIEKMI